MRLERSGGLDYLVGSEEQRVFPALITPGSVDGCYCCVDNVDIEHLRGGQSGVRSRVHDVHVHDERTATSSTG